MMVLVAGSLNRWANTKITFMKKIFFILVLLALMTGGCKLFQPNVMLRTPKDYTFDNVPEKDSLEYLLSSNDVIEFRLFSNDGFKLIDLTQLNNQAVYNQNRAYTNYLVEFDGMVKLPVLGRVSIAGKTIREAELFLEGLYDKYYNDPFVILSVKNRRVIVFPGTGSSAKVIPLSNNNTTLIEAIAQAGGISKSGKAHRVKLIRGDLDNPEVFIIDLSTLDGIKDADMVLQSNDIIYVDAQFNISREILQEITPIVSLVTSALIIIQAYKSLKPTQ